MKSLIIYASVHHGNSKKLAEKLGEFLQAPVVSVKEASQLDLIEYDLVGLGSGIYHGQHHAKLKELAKSQSFTNKGVFVFSTSGTGSAKYNKDLEGALAEGGARVLGSYACKGYDTFGIWKWIGGIAKGHPNDKDFAAAREFCAQLNLGE